MINRRCNNDYLVYWRQQRLLEQLQHRRSQSNVFEQSLKKICKKYCVESSISGLKHIVSHKVSHVERIIWTVTLITAMVCSVSLVWITFKNYYRAPLVTTHEPDGISVSDIIFPSVCICTNNRISKRAATDLAQQLLKEERNKNYNFSEMMTLLLGLGQLYNLQLMNEGLVGPMQLHRALGAYDINEIMRNLTPRCEDVLVRCVWNKKLQNCMELFDFRLTNNGYCCTFNYLRHSDTLFQDVTNESKIMYKYGNKSSFGFDQGLKVLLRMNESDDFYYNVPSQGFQLNFADAYDFPDAPSGSFSFNIINPNVYMTVFVKASSSEASRDIQHIPINLRKCIFHHESQYLPFYTHSDCLLKCRMLFLLTNCNCSPFNMPKIKHARTCDLKNLPCIKVHHEESISVRPLEQDADIGELETDQVGGGIECPMCYPTCSKTAYSYDIYNIHIYPEFLNTIQMEKDEQWLNGANFTGTSILHIKYAKETATSYGENVLMKWFDLISNIGSTCGVITGFSFISILELLYFFTVKLVREMNVRWHNRVKDAPHLPSHNNIENCQPIYWNELSGAIPTVYNNVNQPNSVSIVYSLCPKPKQLPLFYPCIKTCNFHILFIKTSLLDRRMSTKDKFKRYFEIWWEGIKSLPNTTSIHGFRFIADTKRHWTERIFWLIFMLLSWYGSLLLIAAQYDAFQNNPISFVVETTYTDWDTHFPSVAFCEIDNEGRIEHISDGLWGKDHDYNMEEVLRELAYFKGNTYYTSQVCGMENPLPECIKSNFSYYANLVRSPCEDIFSHCYWNDQRFKCCDYFRPMETELGTCFAINTIQGREINPPKLSMISNKTTGPGAIRFTTMVTGNVYVLNEEEVPALTTLGSDVLTVGSEVFNYYSRFITIRNIENDAGARMISPEKRKCRYTDENSLDVYRHYSYSACTVQCRKEAQLKFCNCTNFFLPNVPEHLKCDIKGIMCLDSYKKKLPVLKAKWSKREGLFCDCLPSCTEAEISVVKDFRLTLEQNYSTIQIQLSFLPSERYRRNIVRGALDLVVSTGGTGGLFLGASILSFVEFLYILLIRPFCDIYSQRDDDLWHRKFGARRLEDNKFTPNPVWRYRKKPEDNDLKRRLKYQ